MGGSSGGARVLPPVHALALPSPSCPLSHQPNDNGCPHNPQFNRLHGYSIAYIFLTPILNNSPILRLSTLLLGNEETFWYIYLP